VVDYTKYRDSGYYQLEPPDEYRRTFFQDELNKISRAFQLLFEEFYPAKNAKTVTGDTTATILDDVLLCSGTLTVTLYDAAGITSNQGIKSNAGRRITVKNIGTDTVTIDGAGSQTIDGASTKTMPTQYDVLELFSDGSHWHII
jgi:hypothetical protein